MADADTHAADAQTIRDAINYLLDYAEDDIPAPPNEGEREKANAWVALDRLLAALSREQQRADDLAFQLTAAQHVHRKETELLILQRNAERQRADGPEASAQMGSKLEAEMVLATITEAIALSFADLGNGLKEAAPKILARAEVIVDEAERAFCERDAERLRREQLETALTEIAEYAESYRGVGALNAVARSARAVLAGLIVEQQGAPTVTGAAKQPREAATPQKGAVT